MTAPNTLDTLLGSAPTPPAPKRGRLPSPVEFTIMLGVWPEGERDGASGFLDAPYRELTERRAAMLSRIATVLDDGSRSEVWKLEQVGAIARAEREWLNTEPAKSITAAQAVLATLEQKMSAKAPALSDSLLVFILGFVLKSASPGETIERAITEAKALDTLSAIERAPAVMAEIVSERTRTRARHAIWAAVDTVNFAHHDTLTELLQRFEKAVEISRQFVGWIEQAGEVEIDNYLAALPTVHTTQKAVRDYLAGTTGEAQDPKPGPVAPDEVKARQDLTSTRDKIAFIAAKGYAAFVALPEHRGAQ